MTTAATPPAGFVHLVVRTEYSLVDSVVRVPDLVDAVAAGGMPAVAVTERANLFSFVKLYQAASKRGVKPVLGVDVEVEPAAGGRAQRLALLCRDREGHGRLMRLVSRAHLEGEGRLREAWFDDEGADGLIAISLFREGAVGGALALGENDAARRAADAWRARFGADGFYLGLERLGRTDDEALLEATVTLAAGADLPVVATNDVRFLAPEDFETHEARVCIQEGWILDDASRPRRYTQQQYLKSAEEMCGLFADLPSALENTVQIARRCSVELEFGADVQPQFPVEAGESAEERFACDARAGFERRLAARRAAAPAASTEQNAEADSAAPVDEEQELAAYRERLEYEIGVVTDMGFASYYLVVADFVAWARRNDIPVGPGRGSGAGSLAAWALGITDIDPIAYDLLFERFLNPERVSMPDFDIDFCMEGRDRVIEYVAERYGEDRVSQIITFGTMAAKAVIRDVGRVLALPHGFVDMIAKLVPFDPNMTLKRAFEEEEALREHYENNEDARAIIDIARPLEGLSRNAGRHAGGIVIAPCPLIEHSPLWRDPTSEGRPMTQLDMKDVEAVGMVKFDFLGLKTLTLINWAEGMINEMRAEKGEPPLDLATVSFDDPGTYELLRSGRTIGVFQLESRGIQELMRELKPDQFEDVVALVALYRPGPLQSGMVTDYIARKEGREPARYPHPALVPVLEPTHGVILYQEQVMQIARTLAGYTLGGADELRRAMGKKLPEEMARHRERFVAGAVEREVDRRVADELFTLIEHFAGYGFNRSHSVAYAHITFQTAWLKRHHPAAFMAAAMSVDMNNTDRVVALAEDCRRLGIRVEPPSVNESEWRFRATGEKSIRYGLGAIRGVGRWAVECLLEGRTKAGGAFTDIFDVCRRVTDRQMNRQVLEALIRAGAMDALGATRRAMMEGIDGVMRAAERELRDLDTGQSSLFGGGNGGEGEAEHTPVQLPEVPEYEMTDRLVGERQTTGLYFSGHPVQPYESEIDRFTSARLGECNPDREGQQVFAGAVTAFRAVNTRRGRIAFVTLEDRSGRLELLVPPEVLSADRMKTPEQRLLAKDRILVAEGEFEPADRGGDARTLRVAEVYDLDAARARRARLLCIDVREADDGEEGAGEALRAALEPWLGNGAENAIPVRIHYRCPAGRGNLDLGAAWRIRPCADLLARLKQVPGATEVLLEYA